MGHPFLPFGGEEETKKTGEVEIENDHFLMQSIDWPVVVPEGITLNRTVVMARTKLRQTQND
jgi:hypothetical protein